MKKSFISILLTILLFSCSNAVHDFIPPQNKEIISFGLKTDKMENIPAAEYRNGENIILTVPADTDLSKMIPVIKVSDGASVIPITLEYLSAAFPSMDLLTFTIKLQDAFSSGNLKEWLFEFIRQNPDFNVPSLTLPIDFSQTVNFLVISGQATTRLYQVNVQKKGSTENNGNNNSGGTSNPDTHTMCTITFSSNNGKNKEYTQTFISEKEQNLNPNCFYSSGFTFAGWNTASDGSGTSYKDGQAVTFKSDMILYAQWAFAGFSDEPIEEFLTHTVTFNSNNEVNQEYTQTFISGYEQKLNQNCFYYVAYIFNGWNTKRDGSGTSYTDGQAVTLKSDMILYAQWTYDESVEVYTLTFNSNSDLNQEYTQRFENGKYQNLNLNSFYYVAHIFSGWNTERDGSGTSYTDGQSILITSDMTLYAQWTYDASVEVYTLTFNSNSDVNQEYTQRFGNGKYQKLNQNCFLYNSYEFNCWNTERDGSGTSYTDGQSILIESDMTLYAQWTYDASVEVYTLTFNSNNGLNQEYTQRFRNGKYQNLNKNCFLYSNYEFSSWNTASDGSGTSYADGQSILIEFDTTFYAQWGHASQKDILSFLVNGQIGDAEITENTVKFYVDAETDISSLYPIVKVSDGATVLPLTQKYLLSLGVTFDQVLSFYSGYSKSTDIEEYVAKWLSENNIKLPQVLSSPVDFRDSVVFAVVAADKTVKLYTINCNIKKSDPILEKLAFTKYSNPGLMKDSNVWERSSNNYVAESIYPVEYEDFELIPEFTYFGDRVTYKIGSQSETELISGETKIPFTESNKTCTVTVYKGSNKAVYTVTTKYTFDPDTIRSITDFRFYRNTNPNIKNVAIASIANEGDKGYITVTVNYDGAKPDVLIPTFLSPGTVNVEHVTQQSGISSQNFSSPIEYQCVSKDKQFSRLYTVNVEFNKIEPAAALINSFSIPVYLNKDITYDTQGIIDHENGTIDIEVPYSSINEPYQLMPLFSGTGKVYVEGIVQTSGYSTQDFSNNVYYRVVSVDDESVSKQYVVRASFKKDTDSLCEITSFGFRKGNPNSNLKENINATVTQRTKEIFAYLPYGSGSREAPLAATFEAYGQVYVNGVLQTSGVSLNNFSNPVTYKVVSENGKYEKEYTVRVQENGSIIYVNNRATGHNNGSTWQDAYMTLEAAVEGASNIAAQTPCEIWICDNGAEYVAENPDNRLNVSGTITIKGGFAGTETSASQRNAGKKTKLKGFSFDSKRKECALSIEDIELNNVNSENYTVYMQDYFSNVQSFSLKNVVLGENAKFLITGKNSRLNITNSTLNKANIQLEEIGTFNVASSTFDTCKINENINAVEAVELSDSTFNNTTMHLTGSTQNVENCTFKENRTSNDPILSFDADQTNIKTCNFENYKGTISCRHSTLIDTTKFSTNAELAVGEEGYINKDSKFEAKNCNYLNIPNICDIYNIKITGKSATEKCSLNSTVNLKYSSVSIAKNIRLENAKAGKLVANTNSNNADVYINNCEFTEKITFVSNASQNLAYISGGIYNTTVNKELEVATKKGSSFSIENSTLKSKIYFFGDGELDISSKSTILSTIDCRSANADVSITDSTVNGENLFRFNDCANQITLKNVKCNITSTNLFNCLNVNSRINYYKKLNISDCTFTQDADKIFYIRCAYDGKTGVADIDISNTIFNSGVEFKGDGFYDIDITNGCSFPYLGFDMEDMEKWVTIDDAKIENTKYSNKSGLYSASSAYTVNIDNSTIYSKYEYAIDADQCSVSNCTVDSEGTGSINSYFYLRLEDSIVKRPATGNALVLSSYAYFWILNNKFYDRNTAIGNYYHLTAGENCVYDRDRGIFKNNELLESTSDIFTINACTVDINSNKGHKIKIASHYACWEEDKKGIKATGAKISGTTFYVNEASDCTITGTNPNVNKASECTITATETATVNTATDCTITGITPSVNKATNCTISGTTVVVDTLATNCTISGTTAEVYRATQCTFKTIDLIDAYVLDSCTISPPDASIKLNCNYVKNITLDNITVTSTKEEAQFLYCNFNSTKFSMEDDRQCFRNCTFAGGTLKVNKHSSDFVNCEFKGCTKTINMDSNYAVTQVRVFDSIFTVCTITVQGQRSPTIARVIYTLQNCTFNGNTIKCQSTDEILIPIGSTKPSYTEF